MNRPVRTTIVFGLVSAVLIFPVVEVFTNRWGWSLSFKVTLWADLAVYAALLARWSGRSPSAIVFPLLILLGTALWPWSYAGFFLLGLGTLSWIRSGICFKAPPLRLIFAETVTMAGGAGLVAAMGPSAPLSWSLALWLFFLVQTLYFFIMPGLAEKSNTGACGDAFEAASREAEKILG
ncbi:MAG: hypothetical protein M0036_16975 [Desulfobacteraceae bacterium]|nr:hypothetical protein [Desulfobacteraceae bacterium]